MSAGERFKAYLVALRGVLETPGPFVDVRTHLDLFDLDDALKESFRTPAARVIFAAGKPSIAADGGIDCRGTVIIAAIARREGRPDPKFASADTAALDLAFGAITAVNADPYIGQPKVTPLTPTGIRVALSEKNSKEGLAIVLVEFEMAFLRLVPAAPVIAASLTPVPPSAMILTSGTETLIGGGS